MLRGLACGGLVLGLLGCQSDVDLCGGGSVCGVDGTTYADYCAAGSAGVDVDYAGPCVGGCPVITCEIACAYGLAIGDDGCPRCECAPPPRCDDDTPCVDGDVCLDGRCQPLDAGVPGDAGRDSGAADGGSGDSGVADASPGDSGRSDGGRTDASTCPEGMARCHGACIRLGTLTDCTACDDACALVPEGDPSGMNVCRDDGCDVECNRGYADCDGDPANGCESLHTPRHCGGCDATCLGGTCSTGTCLCPSRTTFCGGACVDTDTNALHCDGCGNRCAAGEACVEGSCSTEEGDPCTNPRSWTCEPAPGGCTATCRGNSFVFDDAGARCESAPGAVCTAPPVLPGGVVECEACTAAAKLCCTGP